MPRVNLGKTPEQRAEEAKQRHNSKVLMIIRMQMGKKDISKQTLADMTLISYKQICRICNGTTSMDLWQMTRIANALGFDDAQRSAVVGGKAV